MRHNKKIVKAKRFRQWLRNASQGEKRLFDIERRRINFRENLLRDK